MDFQNLKLDPDIYKFSTEFFGQRCNFSTLIDLNDQSINLNNDIRIKREISRIVLESVDSQFTQMPVMEYLDLRDKDDIFRKISKLVYRYSKKFCFTDSITSYYIYSDIVNKYPKVSADLVDNDKDGTHHHFSIMGTKFLYYHPYRNDETLIFHDGIEYNLINPKVIESGNLYRESYVLDDRLEVEISSRLINPIRIGLVTSEYSENLKSPDYINWTRIEKLKNLI